MTNRFRRHVESLLLASPVAMLLRYPDWETNKGQCVPVSYAGAAALKQAGIEAQAIGCSLIAIGEPPGSDLSYICAVGHDVDSAYRVAKERLAFEGTWDDMKRQLGSAADGSIHVIIDARDGHGRAFIDLTLGQIKVATNGNIDVPPQYAFFTDDWPQVAFDQQGTRLLYGPSPNSHPQPTEIAGIVGDLADIMRLAQKCRNDATAFKQAVRARVAKI